MKSPWWKRKKRRWQQVRQHKDKDGYLFIVLENATGDREVKRVHELVAQAFIPNPEGKRRVRHKDGNITNNRADNLEWCD